MLLYLENRSPRASSTSLVLRDSRTSTAVTFCTWYPRRASLISSRTLALTASATASLTLGSCSHSRPSRLSSSAAWSSGSAESSGPSQGSRSPGSSPSLPSASPGSGTVSFTGTATVASQAHLTFLPVPTSFPAAKGPLMGEQLLGSVAKPTPSYGISTSRLEALMTDATTDALR